MNVLDIVAGPVFKIIDKLIPDPMAKLQAQQKAMEMAQAGEFKEIDTQLQRDLAQINVNAEEAKNEHLFVSGWRPAVGWICVIGLAYCFLTQPLIAWYAVNHAMKPPPDLDISTLIILLGGMLGIGGMRTVEKIKKVN